MKDIDYRHLIFNGPFAYARHKIICDKNENPIDYIFIEANESFEIATGFKVDNIIGKTIKEITPDIGEMEFDWIKFYGEIALSGGSKTIEQFSKPLGRWYQVKVFSHKKYYFTTIFIDTTDSKISELKLQKALNRNNAFLNAIPDLMFVFDANYKIIDYHANNSLLPWTSPENFANKFISEVAPKHIYELAMEAIDYVIITGRPIKNNYSLLINREITYFEARFILCGKEEVMSIVRDVTDLKHTEEQLVLSEKKYRTIFENTPDVIFQLSMVETIEDISPSCNTFLNYKREELIHQNIGLLFFRQEDKNHFYNTIFQNKKTTDFETLLKPKGGNPIYCSISTHLLKDAAGKTFGIEGSIRNIHTKKNTELELIFAKEKAEENTRLISAFLANMSHEIRTPMNGILGFLNLLKDVNLSISEKENYIEIINKSGQRLLNTINDIIEVSKIDSGALQIHTKEINITELIEDHFIFFQPQAKEKGLSLELKNLIDRELIIISDKDKIDGIFTNLIGNAIKFTKHGVIEIGSSYFDETLHFYIKDTGIGIPKSKSDIIFERFMQVNQNLNRSHEGTGLGLSIIKAYIDRLNGDISVDSIPSIGSTFTVNIPCKSTNQTLSSKEAEDNSQTPTRKALNILIAEDDQASSIFLELILKREGHLITKGHNGKEIVTIFTQNQNFDINSYGYEDACYGWI